MSHWVNQWEVMFETGEFERYMNRYCRYWTFNDKQLQSVVSQFVDIIVFAIVCVVVVVSICKRLCVGLLVTLL